MDGALNGIIENSHAKSHLGAADQSARDSASFRYPFHLLALFEQTAFNYKFQVVDEQRMFLDSGSL